MRRNFRFKDYKNISNKEVFSIIYERGAWGKSPDPSQPYFSGSGSHDPLIVSTYLEAVIKFLESFSDKPAVLDLGCGDFAVGSNIRKFCSTYIACDIVPQLIEFNKIKYATLNVDFRVIDLVNDHLPSADIIIIRQVLQHLSNDDIKKLIPKLNNNYQFVILTEHIPNASLFKHNMDKPIGPDIRIDIQSGVILTSPPFNLKVAKMQKINEIQEGVGIISTILYQMF